jgi:hypothetical protein
LPDYAALGSLPATLVWTSDQLNAAWVPPSCVGWQSLPFRALGASAGRFRHEGAVTDLLARFGAISALQTIRYWSVLDKGWENLITGASALSGPDPSQRRPDFATAEMATSADLYFSQNDNRSTGDVVYRMRVREFAPDRLVVETENVSPVRYLLFSLAGSGDLQAVYFLQRLTPSEWGYYSLVKTGTGASSLTTNHEASYVNRAVAFFRYFAGLPTDQQPPAAP